jgi:DNA-binding MarR family transcriptional regulator
VKCKGLSKSYVSLSVKNLMAKGLLVGRQTETDHKNIYLYVTPEAEAICNEGLKAQRKYLDILLGGFEKEEVDQFLVYFNRINKNVKNTHDEKLAAKKKKKTS